MKRQLPKTREQQLEQAESLLAGEELEAARAIANNLIQIAPRWPETHMLAARVAAHSRDGNAVAQAVKHLEKLAPKAPETLAELARHRMMQGLITDAYELAHKAYKTPSENGNSLHTLATLFSQLGLYDKAEELLIKARVNGSQNRGVRLLLSRCQNYTGKEQEAIETLEELLEEVPGSYQAYYSLSRLVKSDEGLVERMHAAEKLAGDNEQAKIYLGYGLGKQYEDIKDYENAFAAYSMGAQAKRSVIDFDPVAEKAIAGGLVEHLNREWWQEEMAGCNDPSPIFIIGMPRTGTTLVERIIAAHSEVYAAGELQQFSMVVNQLAQIPGGKFMSPEAIEIYSYLDPEMLGERYLDESKYVRGNAKHFIDKMPINYRYVGLIAKALPNAKFIHLVRHPMDTCWSNFKHLFAEAYKYSYDLIDTAEHYLEYSQVMAHWHDIMPGRILDVSYENVVQDTEAEAKRMISYLGLDWQDACAHPHETSGPVSTPSANQVREKPHTKSIGKWQKYGDLLAPAREQLEGHVFL